MQNKIYEHRSALRLSQQKLADQIGIARSGLCLIEKGTTIPSVEVALRLSAFFNVKVEDLFQLKEK